MNSVPAERPEHPYESDRYQEPPTWFIAIGAVIVIAVLAIGLTLLVIAVTDATKGYSEFARRDALVQECLDSDHYTRQECITLAGEQ